jgi:hypothetical protein
MIAYQNLKMGEDTANLIDAYERILTNIHIQGNDSGKPSSVCPSVCLGSSTRCL